MHQLEFSKTEISSDYGPYGLSLIFKLLPRSNIDNNLEDCLKVHSLFDKLHKLLNDNMYLSNLIEKYMIKNQHFAEVILLPDTKLSEKEDKQEKEHLAQVKEKLTDETKKLIVKNSTRFKRLPRGARRPEFRSVA